MKLGDGKTFGSKWRLTTKEIDKLQNSGNLDGMKDAIDAILRHRLSIDDLPNRTSFPLGPDSWCRYQNDPDNYRHFKSSP